MEGAISRLGELGVELLYVYTREPHAGQRMRDFDFSDEPQTGSVEERMANAARCRQKYGFKVRWIIDGMDGAIQEAYGGLPNSLFLVRSDGVVAFKQAWADADAMLAEASKLKPPAWYTASEEEKALLMKVYEAGTRALRSRKAESRLSAVADLAELKHRSVLPRLGFCLRDPEPEVRASAWKSLLGLVDGLPVFDPGADGEERAQTLPAVAEFLRKAERTMRFDDRTGRFAPGTSAGEEKPGLAEGGRGQGKQGGPGK